MDELRQCRLQQRNIATTIDKLTHCLPGRNIRPQPELFKYLLYLHYIQPLGVSESGYISNVTKDIHFK